MDKEIKLEIKSRFTGNVIFEYESVGNTMRKTVEEAARTHANLCGANLRDVNLRDVNLCGVNLCDADLRGVNLYGADLRGANLCGANLYGADLCDANLYDANLRDANLRDVNLCGANLCGADLCDANLHGANLCGCVLDYDDNNSGYSNLDRLKSRIEANSNLKLTKLYENHDTFASRWGVFWRNLIIIREWEVVDKEEAGAIKVSESLYKLIESWLENSLYSNKSFCVSYESSTDGPVATLTIFNTSYQIAVRGLTGIGEGRLYKLQDGKIVEA